MEKIKKYNQFLLMTENITTNKMFSDKIINLLNMMVEKNSMESIQKLNDKLMLSIIIQYDQSAMYFKGIDMSHDNWYVRYTTDPTDTEKYLRRRLIIKGGGHDFLKGLYELILYRGSDIDNVFKKINTQ